MFSRFFIDRPIFAAVLSVFIIIAGLASMRTLPIAQYPEIAPPVVTVRAVYPGASAQILEQTVAAPLENQITGVENMTFTRHSGKITLLSHYPLFTKLSTPSSAMDCVGGFPAQATACG
jgi:multidrug efflux pump subunit AcrB